MQPGAIAQSLVNKTPVSQITAENRNIFQTAADKFVAVVNSCKTFSTGCSTQKDHNIMKACGALLAQTLVKQECYTEGFTGGCVKQLDMALPDKIFARSETGVPGSASVGRLSALKASECSAQELYDMLSKQLHKPDTAPEMQEKIRMVLEMAEKGADSKSVRGTEFAEIAERYADNIRRDVISDILLADDINNMEHGPVLKMADVIRLRSMKDS
ncbi:TPA: hypothetical protein RG697_001787 [Morganella morganii]|uniref:hypothetical protein n=1 Tax=Morganella morganii TaxID=582 RepID=UPI001BDA5952|nr:hypothetical protein [Morganella morganii]MBT0382220.1 hypothetical protein [Morganella morganii subsp. morganii]HBL6966878.1 hypothetical protein [Morganella morganii]HDU8610185.1 hypothetical protein [Morganella morganii]